MTASSPERFDFSGNYAFVSTATYMHRLDESIRPLLEARGGTVLRIHAERGHVALSPRDASLDGLPDDFFRQRHIRAVFTTDYFCPAHLVPAEIPLIALHHAFFCLSGGQTMTTALHDYAVYCGNADYYLHQGAVAPFPVKPASLRRRDHVYLLPFGNLKLDELRRRWQAETDKNQIVYCCGYHGLPITLEEKQAFVATCLRHFPAHTFWLRPFPGERARYKPLEEAFRGSGRFRIDSSRSTLRHLPSAAAVLCDHLSTTGFVYSLATGRPSVVLASGAWREPGPEAGTLYANTPEQLVGALRYLLSVPLDREHPGLTALREEHVYRPGHSRELFYRYLAQILSGRVPEEALAQPCEYIGDLCLDSSEEELAFFLKILRACRVECHYMILPGRFARCGSLMSFYHKLATRRQNRQPVMIALQRRANGGRLLADEQCASPFFCPAPPEAYLPETREFVRRNEALRLAAEPEEGDARILLPDADKAFFCATLADCLERVHGSRGAAVAHNVTQ